MAKNVEDIHNQDKRFKRALEKRMHEFGRDQKSVENFLNQLFVEGLSPARLSKYVYSLVVLKRMIQVNFIDAEEEDIKQLVASIGNCDRSHWTKHSYRVILKRYLRYLGKEPEWLKAGHAKRTDVSPEEILSEEDVKQIAENAYTKRDRAFVLALYESGTRIGEFLPLKLKHLEFDRHGCLIRVNGKTGPRRIRLVFSSLSIQKWIDEHPSKNNSEAYLWCKIPMPNNPKWVNKHLSYGFVSRLIKELAEKAKVKKGVNPHAFRHARATFMARHLKEPEMREFFGWGRDSDMPSIYVHLSGRDVDSSVLRIYGIKDVEKSQEPVLKVHDCPRCNESNDPAMMFCQRCGLPFKEEGLDTENQLEGVVVELLKAMAQTNPTIKGKFREIVREKGVESLFS